MKELNDGQKIVYIIQLNKISKITQYQRRRAKRFIIDMYEQAIYEHNQALGRFENHEITYDEIGNIQKNCIQTISVLKMINQKHKLYKRLLDERDGN